MKTFELIEQPTTSKHPQEDFLLSSKKYPILAVADGVTLVVRNGDKYPEPSGAGAVAEIFCERAIKVAEELYDNFSEKDILTVFDKANKSIGEYNKKHGRTEGTIDYGVFDLFHATAAFALVKENKIFWATICDAGMMLVNSNGTRKFTSPPCWGKGKRGHPSPEGWETWSEEQKAIYIHKGSRNKLSEAGERIGYGVLTGEEEVLQYVRCGMLDMETGDVLFVFTDGFENYFEIPEFLNIFTKWPSEIKKEVRKFTHLKSEEDFDKFGRERSLIAVKLTL